jgi:hypothetical protein
VFVGEGLPPILLALVLPWLLPNSPDDTQGPANFLTPEELCLLKADVSGGGAWHVAGTLQQGVSMWCQPNSPFN